MEVARELELREVLGSVLCRGESGKGGRQEITFFCACGLVCKLFIVQMNDKIHEFVICIW